jgi:hypothetical protein
MPAVMPDGVEQDSEEKGKAENQEDANNALLRFGKWFSVLILADVAQAKLLPVRIDQRRIPNVLGVVAPLARQTCFRNSRKA